MFVLQIPHSNLKQKKKKKLLVVQIIDRRRSSENLKLNTKTINKLFIYQLF